ncbi:HypC/HybG/HupF family hydrogenase formation chaperone [Oceanidesulfovibrio marinus]|uniref:HypC/HybG/HupF family hydrogenase formation chaperone n=1 Tax=Oceanidesulfovibrio marinus TaxID=370038 RepID=A0A6P1ZLW3_9BACT|nr:HypC/HybG/HupF family hydrogenase formation chaperone [Oceanidesulfovibrio marinus]QJT08253.1 HypC/HybG/HupF family hydrogenase formation chaperone [Oceanidesulfovibrio marinus]TVM35146.1 HypC/HybG/HupF family hydrogenase formation chaperone [Oceanidesulfovibrio marinus]
MCLAIPAKIVDIEEGVANCRVGDSDTFIKVSLMLMDGAVEPGEYLIVHAGFALRKLDEKEALETLQILRDMAELQSGEQAGF